MNKISEYRKATNLTQTEFATLLNLTQGALGHYESGRRTPDLDTARRIVRLLNENGATCSLDDVFPLQQ
ncbi:helix-turn-helix transcriptional regulator [Avibacterium paragallinarum]|uniref:XRE family transcriptional regulator n=1 Tax=Avibacterium paragallinarum TaxID=728 RepID=A0AAE5TGG4_AVIPA|nr:helix-turn-helix transcriptional regulator [Avibacterium paragallinarum]MEE3609366.1 helix-turn-helix transcriptional regulator [Avibacterium paragallinarum]MEE3621494.1 helix-turn-helix transcriptional regulator [Avibacterium paragallinarum]MEE3669365.1 helix-turn-helix transcriptional regulator [Avibacterium paragallinarum]MEE3681669.1 helix-turn-helix transcriptional regulator [Avibacterium paragallinarum]MEE4386671.1 helix-turn-helix transcriptional regulator [Avibacterium paragallinaru